MIFSIPTALSETITFSELGMATEVNRGYDGTTPIGTFYSTSNEYPVEVTVNAHWRNFYRLIVYLNDAQINSGQIIGNVNFSAKFPKENIKNGKNTIYVVGNPWGAYPFGDQFGSLIIYGNSKISSPSIFLPPPTPTFTPTPSPIQTIIQTTSPTPPPTPTAIAKDITFSELGLASEFGSGTSFRTPNATFYSNSTDYPLEVSVISYFEGPYYLIIYLNDMQVESRKIIEGIQGGKVTFSGKFNNIRKGNNTLYISGYTIGRMEFGLYGNNLIIYGDSKISSPSIFLPPTPTLIPNPPPISTQSNQNIILPIILIFLSITFILVYIGKQRKAFGDEQTSKGFVKCIDRFGIERWVTPQENIEVEILKKEYEEVKMRESLSFRVIESINKFEPSYKWSYEEGYHAELIQYLKQNYPNAKAEHTTGASRPDIVIDNIAIEVKGPTDNQALDTLTTKCLKYSHHYTHFIIVLFEPRFSESNYTAIYEGIKKHFPHVEVIRKNGNGKKIK